MSRTVTDPQPLLFFAWLAFGICSILFSIVILGIHPEILFELPVASPVVIGWTHLLILGWFCSLFFAAGYQLTPVVTLQPLISRWMCRIHFGLHLIGVPVMVIAFFTSQYNWLAIGGTFVIAGFSLFALNAIFSAGMQPRWNALSLLWFTAIFWLLVGSIIALIAVFMRLQILRSTDFEELVGIHIHTMILGFFMIMLIAAASKLVPMFMLSSEKPQYGTWIAGMVLNVVIFAIYFGIGRFDTVYRSALTWFTLAALLAYYAQLGYFAVKKRRKWDAGLVLFYLGNSTLIAAWLQFFQFHRAADQIIPLVNHLRNGVFLVTFLGFNGCILGMAQKIVPFMLWHHLYARYLGKAKVPQTIEMLHTWSLWPMAICYNISAALFITALFGNRFEFIRPAVFMMLLAFAFLISNACKFTSHWKKPKIIPFKSH